MGRAVGCLILELDLGLLDILSSQLIDHPSTSSFRAPSLWDMFSLTGQRCIVTLITWKLSIASNSYDFQFSSVQFSSAFDSSCRIQVYTAAARQVRIARDMTYVVVDSDHTPFFDWLPICRFLETSHLSLEYISKYRYGGKHNNNERERAKSARRD